MKLFGKFVAKGFKNATNCSSLILPVAKHAKSKAVWVAGDWLCPKTCLASLSVILVCINTSKSELKTDSVPCANPSVGIYN